MLWPTLEVFLSTGVYLQRQSPLPPRVTWLFFHVSLEFQVKKEKGPLGSPWHLLPPQAWVKAAWIVLCDALQPGSDVNAAGMIRRGKDFFPKLSFVAAIFTLLSHRHEFYLPPVLASLLLQTKGTVLWTFSVVLWVALLGQRSSCSDLVFSNKCALWCSTLLRDNTAQAGEFSVATNKTQVRLCQATSDYLNKCQRRNQTLELSASDPQDKGPIDFPH